MTECEYMEQFKAALSAGKTVESLDLFTEKLLYEIKQERETKGGSPKLITWDNFNEIVNGAKKEGTDPKMVDAAYWITSEMACSLMYGRLMRAFEKRGKGTRGGDDENIKDYFSAAAEMFYTLMDKYDPSRAQYPVYISFYIDGLSWKFNNDGSPYLGKTKGIRILGQNVLEPGYEDEKGGGDAFERVGDESAPSVEESYDRKERIESSSVFEAVVYDRVVDPFWDTVGARFAREAAREKIRIIENSVNEQILRIDAKLEKDISLLKSWCSDEVEYKNKEKELNQKRNNAVSKIRNAAKTKAALLRDTGVAAEEFAMAAVWEKFLGGVNSLPAVCKEAFCKEILNLGENIKGIKLNVDVDIFNGENVLGKEAEVEPAKDGKSIGTNDVVDLFAELDEDLEQGLV